MKTPLISIIMPVRDGESFLGPALMSIRSQSIQDFQTIVVDDGSIKPVEEMVHAVLPDALVVTQPNGGPAAARNLGLTKAVGAYVAFLDADDLWRNDTLSLLIGGFSTAPAVGVTQGLVRRFRTADDGSVEALGLPHAGFNLGALMIRKEAIDKIGTFDPRLRESEDVDYFIRMRESRVERLVIPNTVLDYRQHPSSVTAVSAPRPLQTGHVANWLRLVQGSLARRRALDVGGSIAPKSMFSPSSEITVALVVRQGIRFLPAALESVRQQILAPSEIIAVVGESTDGTLEFLRAQPEVRSVEQEGTGLAAGRNQAVREARGRYIAFLDHDDLWRADKLLAQAGSISLFSTPAACITNFREVRDEEGGDPSNPLVSPHQFPRLGWTPSALLAHRDVFERVGEFDPALGMGCDTDWFRRLRNAGVPLSVATPVLLHKRRRDDNLSSDVNRNREAMFRIIGKHRAEMRRDSEPAEVE